MAVSATLSNHFKYMLGTKQIDIENDSIKCLLMRSGFVFNRDDHAILENIKGTTGAIVTIAFVDGGAGNDSITDSGSGFVTAGLVVGNSITVSGSVSNDGTYEILSVVAGTIEIATASLTAEGAGASVTITADDELATGNGYTQDTKTSGTVSGSEDDSDNRGEWTFPTVTWNASGGSIGPTPGMLLYDDDSTDDTIIGYIDFGAEEEATDGNPFDVSNNSIYIA